MAYEIYYAFACTSTTFEVFSFLVWYFMDLAFATVAIKYAYPPSRRTSTAVKLFFGVLLGLGFLHGLCLYFPDEREQITAFWTGVYLELPIGWGALYLLLREGNTKGHSIEIWLTRFLGCYCAFAVFVWRYLNVPENWEYVASPWSVGGMVVTLIPEHIYPFAYIWVLKKERKAKVE
ncbi:hypothetical protein CC78DRAFT_533474 [Lojkania enalia]|uniref:Uncharacterized protein n=1 Tax=Lojkania enalia TaxID=147567 RepID=A0A9P4K7H4_9PLEO|nr:hypothetical protein CC78DRAFT_533474 [Didymosphaeria enalia]